MCSSILGMVERAETRKCVAVYLGRLKEQQKESVYQYEYTWEVERAAKRKCVAVYLARFIEQKQESVWQYT